MNITKSNITEVIPNSNANCGNTNIPQTVKLIDIILIADCHYNNSPFVSTQFRASPFERALLSALNRVLLIN